MKLELIIVAILGLFHQGTAVLKPPRANSKVNGGIQTSAPIRVAFQGEPGAYSEKAARELLGSRVLTEAKKSFEDVFRAVASREADYACVPIENSLGGSIHTNYDLLLRYDLHIIAEHEFRVEHSLLALPGVKKGDIKKVMSHPQALAQCDNYIRAWGVNREETYDTAGSAKMIKDGDMKDCAAIASDLAGSTYGLEVLDTNIEDHDNNFTRFLLLSRQPVSSLIPPGMPAKTSIVFVLPNLAGALYKALACFSLRDIDFCKIESRPTSVQLLQFLQFQNANSKTGITESPQEHTDLLQFKGRARDVASQDLPRFR
jgi:prephenate dehydratase